MAYFGSDLVSVSTNEAKNYTLDLSPFIPAGRTISGVVLSKVTLAGNDYTTNTDSSTTPPTVTHVFDAPTLTLGTPTIVGNLVTFKVSTAVAACLYVITMTVTLDDAEVIVLWTHLQVDTPD